VFQIFRQSVSLSGVKSSTTHVKNNRSTYSCEVRSSSPSASETAMEMSTACRIISPNNYETTVLTVVRVAITLMCGKMTFRVAARHFWQFIFSISVVLVC